MTTVDPRLERYLVSLESTLRPFPVSDRAEIITEIKSHVLEAIERDPNANIETVLAALGEPETVANRYLMERGLKTTKPSISPVVKWIVIGFLGTFAMLLLFAGFVMTRFMPLVKVNEKEQHVTLLGGLIEVNGDKVDIKIEEGLKNVSVKGTAPVSQGQPVAIRFTNGAFAIETSSDGKLSWNCRARELKETPPQILDGKLVLDLTKYDGIKCDIQIPQDTQFAVDGRNGHLSFSDVRFGTRAHMENGKISFRGAEKTPYRFQVKSSRPNRDEFVSSQDSKAYEIVLEVENGVIEQN